MQTVQACPVTQDEQKQPYEKPAIVYQAPLEAMASDCTASPGKNTCSTLYS